MAASTPIWVSAEYSLSGQYSCALNLSCTGEVKLGLWYGSKVLDTGLGTKGRETDLQSKWSYFCSTSSFIVFPWENFLSRISLDFHDGEVSWVVILSHILGRPFSP